MFLTLCRVPIFIFSTLLVYSIRIDYVLLLFTKFRRRNHTYIFLGITDSLILCLKVKGLWSNNFLTLFIFNVGWLENYATWCAFFWTVRCLLTFCMHVSGFFVDQAVEKLISYIILRGFRWNASLLKYLCLDFGSTTTL